MTEASRPTTFDVVVPALLIQAARSPDFAGTRRYARAAAATWIDYFLLSGSTTQGHLLNATERARVLDLWLEAAEPTRLLACCWTPADIAHARDRGIAIIAPLQGPHDPRQTLAVLRTLPLNSFVYSHPVFGGAIFDAGLAAAARDENVLPAGGKLAKVSIGAIRAIREAAGETFALWDGSSRRIRLSLAAGATGIVATPLSAFEHPLPTKDVQSLQASIDPQQARLDTLPDRATRTQDLLDRAARSYA
jgi:dihydrodipicolinate synthase/N-acetylneuraminate lyase